MKLLLLSHDLMIGSRVEGAARQFGLTTATLRTADATVAAAADEECRLLLIDLRLPGLDIATLVTSIRDLGERNLPIIACGPHVHEANLAAAREAGCDAVVTRGQLDREAEAIFGELLKAA